MNKIKKFIWIPIVVVVAIVVTIVVLCVVKVNPILDNFGGYERVKLLVSSDGNEAGDVLENGVNLTQTMLKEGLEDASFSYMHALLEGKYSYGLKFKTTENDDGERENVMISAKEIAAYGAYEEQYVIKMYFDEVRTLNVGGEKIYYDAVLFRLYDGQGEVVDVECVPYMTANIGNSIMDDEPNEDGLVGSDSYKTNVLLVKMNTSQLMINIREYKEQQGF